MILTNKINKIALILACVLLLTACGSQSPDKTDSPSGSDNASFQNEEESGNPASFPYAGTAQNSASSPNAETTENPVNAPGMTAAWDASASENTGSQTSAAGAPGEGTPLALHGALHVDGERLVDQNGDGVRLCGVSTHGLAWFPQYVNYDAFQTLRDDWQVNCVRLAMYTAEYGGYCSGGDRDALKALVQSGVEYASDLGMYVIIDWHILSDQDPNVYKQDSISFFEEMSAQYADYDNVLYEICNEPNGYATWSSVKSYAEEVIPVIRANDSDAVVLVGTPTWSQDIDQAAADPLSFDNIMYTLHFYAATHKDYLRDRLETCVSGGLPVFVSEFGICDASGNGSNDPESASQWMELLEQYDISCVYWNLANKNESSSAIRSDCAATAGWQEDELSEAGKWIREYYRSRP